MNNNLMGDDCRCEGKDCDRRDTCLRYICLRDKIGPDIISVCEKMCYWSSDKVFEDSFIGEHT